MFVVAENLVKETREELEAEIHIWEKKKTDAIKETKTTSTSPVRELVDLPGDDSAVLPVFSLKNQVEHVKTNFPISKISKSLGQAPGKICIERGTSPPPQSISTQVTIENQSRMSNDLFN